MPPESSGPDSRPRAATVARLTHDRLYRRCDPQRLGFSTTSDLQEDLAEAPGLGRATGAIRFGIGIRHHGYHMFAMGPSGSGKHAVVRQFLEREAKSAEPADDWCYVHDFSEEHKPRPLRFPAGRATEFCEDMRGLVEDLAASIRAGFETEEYRVRVQELEGEAAEEQERRFQDLQERAKAKGIAVVRTPSGLALAPMRDGDVLNADEFKKLPEDERNRLDASVKELQDELQRIMQQVPRVRREIRGRKKDLDREVAEATVEGPFEELRSKWSDLGHVRSWLEDVRRDVVDNAASFRREGKEESPLMTLVGGQAAPDREEDPTKRYRVNVIIDHRGDACAPVVHEDHPTYENLVGRVEHRAVMGALLSDFTLIRPGALHKGNGGFLILEAHKLLTQPYAWEGLKRALRSREIRIEPLGRMAGLLSTRTLEPRPVELDVKVVLLGERYVYYLLEALDPEFGELFKVQVDFDERMDRSDEDVRAYAGFLASLIRQEHLLPFDASGVARVIEQASRLVEDTEKLSIERREILALLNESEHWARIDGHEVVQARHVQRAIDERIHRADRLRQRSLEEVERGNLLIDVEGEKVGQINGLSVIQLGRFSFGRPTRITARVRLGSGKLIDIERESELGRPIHSKGVLILSGFLAGRFVPDRPLSLTASLVFEQSYAGVDGDSASSAELYALLSALAGVPIRQSLAVTGSVNQHGRIQAIGGVNEKIEGFFDVCRDRGLTGEQGVLIPESNVKHLMLRSDVVEAVEQNRFHVYPVSTVQEGIELLTGLAAGERGDNGEFPAGSVNRLVEDRLASYAERAGAYLQLKAQEASQ